VAQERNPMNDESLDQTLDTDPKESALEITGEEVAIEGDEVELENDAE
jgi:hypothetical protein